MLLDQLTRQYPHRQLTAPQLTEPDLPAGVSEPALSIKSEPGHVSGVKREKTGEPGLGNQNKKIKVER